MCAMSSTKYYGVWQFAHTCGTLVAVVIERRQQSVSTRESDLRMVRKNIYISEEASRMIDEMGKQFFPGRPRIDSQTIEKIVRERYEQEREKEGKRDD